MPSKYPGRDIVMSRHDAADIAYRQLAPDQFSGTRERFQCLNPYVIRGIGLPSSLDALAWMWAEGAYPSKIPVEVSTRCRKCAPCLEHRQRLWAARAIDETLASNRTWFGTLTINPAQRFRYRLLADQRLERRGHGSWSSQSEGAKFKALVDVIGPDITKWLKRVRKQSGAALRYLLVSEAHKDGFPHFHILVHERSLNVTERTLRKQWLVGFSHFRLVDRTDRRAASYVCKYLSKDAQTRVRGSVRYGQAELVRASTERLQRVTRLLAGETSPVEERGERE